MTRRRFLDSLLNGAEVTWTPLAEVTLPTSNIKWADAYGSYRYIDLTSVDRKTRSITETNDITAGTAPSRAQKLVETDDIIFATTRPAQQRFCLITPEWTGAIASTGYCVLRSDRSKVLPGWLLHWLSSPLFRSYVEENQSGSAYPAISDDKVKAFKIPIPCPDEPERSIEIQAEIVRILNGFSTLTAQLTLELTAELRAREKQYDYYREQLLVRHNGSATWKALDELGEFIRGRRFTKADYVDEGISAIHYGEIYTYYGVSARETLSKVNSELAQTLRYAQPNDVIIAGVSETVEDVGKSVAWLGDEKVAIHDDSFAFRHSMNPKFIVYAMQTKAFHNAKAKHVARGKIKRLLIDGIKKVELPIPYADDPAKSLEEQARIVAILDEFESLTKSLGEGLSREVDLRSKQYEYYRDLLLSFPPPVQVAKT